MENEKYLRAVLTGVAGQDGSYLSEHLLGLNYTVIGISRRKSVEQGLTNIQHLISNPNFHLLIGDITDSTFISRTLHDWQPHEYYGLAAMSNVGQSFKEPLNTFRTNAEAVIMQLEMIRQLSPSTRYYQASTSELFGGINCPEEGYDESSPIYPRSPYAVAKAAAYYAVINYREAYGIHASNGILFNHSCIAPNTAVIIKRNKNIEIVNPTDILRPSVLEVGLNLSDENIDIWDGEEWVKLKSITAKPVKDSDLDMVGQITNTRSGVVFTTKNHNLLDKNSKKVRADSVGIGTNLLHGKYPMINRNLNEFSVDEAELIGLIVGDGWIHKEKTICHIGNNSDDIVERIRVLWSQINNSTITIGKFYNKKGSFGKSRNIKINNFSDWHYAGYLRDMIYNFDNKKKIPIGILNSSVDVQLAFLNGYNMADGLKKNKCRYKFKNFKTNSQELAAGLLLLIHNTTKQTYNLNIEYRNNKYYYSINLLSDKQTSNEKQSEIKHLLSLGLSQREINRRTGISRVFIRKVQNNEQIITKHYRFLNRAEVKKILNTKYNCVYDIETESGKFMAGAGSIVIANSPRRGFDFATRKITSGIAKIKLGLEPNLKMGNLDVFRDEGHVKDHMKAMHLILQQETPDDYVICTETGATIKEMLEYVCELAELDFENVYEMDQDFMRPSDVKFLKGNATKARLVLGWAPEYTWKETLKEMYENDLKILQKL